MKRYVSIDFLRGLTIVLMLMLHIFIETFDTNILLKAVLEGEGSIVLIIFAVILVYLASFAGLFMIISGFGNMISMLKQTDRLNENALEINYKKIRNTMVFRGLMIFFIGYFVSAIFWPYVFGALEGVLLQRSMDGYWRSFTIDIFWFQIIQSVGLAQIFLGLIYSTCLKHKLEINSIKKVLWSIVIIIFIVTPFILFGIRSILGFWPFPHHNAEKRSFLLNLGFFFLTIIGGKDQAIFPWHSMVFIGALIALDLYKSFVSKKFVRKWFLIGFLMFLFGLIFQLFFNFISQYFVGDLNTYFIYGFGGLFDYSGPSSAYMLFIGGGEVVVTTLFLWLVEGRNRSKKFAENTVFIRRHGVITLTIYSLQPITFIPIIFLEKAFGLEPLQQQETIWQSLTIISLCLILWFVAVYFWENKNFIGSFDWMFSKLLEKRRKGALNRLDPDEVLYNVEPLGEPISFIDNKQKQNEIKIPKEEIKLISKNN